MPQYRRCLATSLVLAVALWLIFALLGYRISWRHQVLRGVTPWRFPSYVWAAICSRSGPVGLAVELLAEFTTKPRLPSSLSRVASRDASTKAAMRGSATIDSQRGSATIDSQRGSATIDSQPRSAPAVGASYEDNRRTVIEIAPTPTGPPPPLDATGKTAPFGWYADPLSRHEKRYFDGRGWLDLVADGGVRSSDPIER